MVFRMNLLSIYILRSISYNKTLYEATGDVTVAPGNFHFFFFQSCLFCSILSLLINIHNFGKYSNHFDLFRDIQIDITEFTLGHFIFETLIFLKKGALKQVEFWLCCVQTSTHWTSQNVSMHWWKVSLDFEHFWPHF